MFSLPELSSQYGQAVYPHLTPHLFPLMNILLTGGLLNLLCVSLTLDHGHRDHRGSGFALTRYILPSAVFATVSNIPKFLMIKTVHHEGSVLYFPTGACNISKFPTAKKRNYLLLPFFKQKLTEKEIFTFMISKISHQN